jgi:hypothetical protein|nr:MAG TPA: hypothetical protein [Caudoviricetes sp.]
MTAYQTAKTMLRAHAEYVSVQYRGDKPAIRESINDYADSISKDYHLSNVQIDRLSNYACSLHPKN